MVTRNRNFNPDGVWPFLSVDNAIAHACEDGVRPIIIGGAEIYLKALPRVERIYLTEIDRAIPGDTIFSFDRTQWVETERRAGSEPDVTFLTLERV